MEKSIKEQMLQFKGQLQTLLDKGIELRKVSQITYQWREEGKNIPYMAITDTSKDRSVIRITATPISKQKDLKQFFDEKAPGSRLPKFQLYAEDGVVVFKEKLGYGSDNFIEL